MTGAKLAAIRQALGLELPWFASLLGLHAAKLQRWEAAEEVSLHPLQAHILSVLDVQVRLLGPRAPELGRRILKGVMLYGPPYGLLVLLQVHFEGHVPEFVPSGDSRSDKPKQPV
jgi:hypothetical protein